MMSIGDAGTRYPQKFRIVCSAGEPLNPEAIRWFRDQYGITVLDYYGLTESYPLCANFPFMEVREGSMGKPMPGWEVAILDEDERPVATGRARRDLPAGALATRTTRSATGTARRRTPRRRSAATGSTPRTPPAPTRTATIWYEGRADDVIISAGYRIGPFEVESACLEHPAVAEAAAVAVARRAPRERGQGVRRAGRRARAVRRARRGDQGLRPRPPSAYAYPRRIEFVPDLPKTLTGKIRRIELRQQERDSQRYGRPPPNRRHAGARRTRDSGQGRPAAGRLDVAPASGPAG